jgi:signal transduction histidine kinase
LETVRHRKPEAAEQAPAARAASLLGSDSDDIEDVVARGVDALLAITRSPVGFAGLVGENGETVLISRTAGDDGDITRDAMNQLSRRVLEGDQAAVATQRFIGAQLRAGDGLLGTVVVANGGAYTPADRQAVAYFAEQIATSIEVSRLRKSRQSLVESLVNMRAELELSERRRLLSDERVRSAERLERAQAQAVEALSAISGNLRLGEDLADFYRLLTATVAELVGARKVLFWELTPERKLVAIPGAYGIDDEFVTRLFPAPANPDGTDLTSQVVYQDLIFRAAVGEEGPSDRDRRVLDTLRVENAISVPWRAGEERLGVVAAYDSKLVGGFTREDAWVLQIIGLVAGLVWQLKHKETELSTTVKRLQKVDAARQLLLRNLSTAVDRAQKRFANQLHDDALQKLTAAELGLERAVNSPQSGALDETRELLMGVEDALRKLLFDVRPPALESPGGLEETIRDRVELLRAHTGVALDVEIDIPNDPRLEIKSLVYRQVAEAVTNIEKHSGATRVSLKVMSEKDGIYGAITDNGRGFVVEERSHLPGHLGLLALNERALLAGGWCKISSEPGAGTIVEFWVPLPG